MPDFASTPAPVHTLWDTPDMATQRLPGVWWVTTPSHGGFVLSDERQAAMPEALRLDSIYYEEDVNWSLVVIGFARYEGPDFTGLCDAVRYDSTRPVNTFAALGVELLP